MHLAFKHDFHKSNQSFEITKYACEIYSLSLGLAIKRKIISQRGFVLKRYSWDVCSLGNTCWAKIVRAKKPLVASSFLQGNLSPVPGYLTLITAEILYNFVLNRFSKPRLRRYCEILCASCFVLLKFSIHSKKCKLLQNLTYIEM